MVYFKKLLTDEFYTNMKSKGMTSLAHVQAIKHATEFTNKKILIVVDRMKEIEMNLVSALVDSNKIIFRDSKDSKFPFIQFADIFAGLLREHFEEYETCTVQQALNRKCKFCRLSKKLCKKDKKNRAAIRKKNIFTIKNVFYSSDDGKIVGHGILLNPIGISWSYMYLDCLK